PHRNLRQRQGKPEREAGGKAHGAVHVEAVLALGCGPPLIGRHPECADGDRLAAMAGENVDRGTRLHAVPSPFTSRRVRNNTKGRFCMRQVSKASGIELTSSGRSTM